MKTAAFESVLGGSNDELSDGCEISEFEKRRRDTKIPIVLVDFVAQDIDSMMGPRKAAVAAHDSDVVPHETADFIPVLRDHHSFVTRLHFPVPPVGNLAHGRLISPPLDRFFGSGIGEDERFEQ
jgi:hypothetical protein